MSGGSEPDAGAPFTLEMEADDARACAALLVAALLPARENSIVTLLLAAGAAQLELLAGTAPSAAPVADADADVDTDAAPVPKADGRSAREVTNEKAGARPPLLPVAATLRFWGAEEDEDVEADVELEAEAAAFAEDEAAAAAAADWPRREPELVLPSGACCCELVFREAAPRTVRLYSTRSLSRIGTKHCGAHGTMAVAPVLRVTMTSDSD